MTVIEFINDIDLDIPSMLVITRVQLLASFFNNDLTNDILVLRSKRAIQMTDSRCND